MKPAYILQLMLKVIGVLAALFDFSGVCSSGDEVHDGHGRPGEQAQGFLPLGCRGQGVCVCARHTYRIERIDQVDHPRAL